jgi:succinate dehydrogenase / fumarate reductase membrane anchor subunit
MSVNYGSKRTVVGAHYGTRDWLVQRVTAVLMALFTVVCWCSWCSARPHRLRPVGRHLCRPVDEVLTFGVIVALAWHAWIGVRDIWMDYVKPVGLRLALQVFTIVWLVGCAGWGIQVLWRL